MRVESSSLLPLFLVRVVSMYLRVCKLVEVQM